MLWTVSLNAILVTAANTIYMPGFKQVQTELDTTAAMVTLTVTSCKPHPQPFFFGMLVRARAETGTLVHMRRYYRAGDPAACFRPTR